jgi:hypothetical protein
MDYGVRVFYGGSVRREDCQFEDMSEDLEWFDGPPSFSDLCERLGLKFGDAFTLKGRFDVGKNRAHYVMMELCNQAEWSRYNRVIQGSNVGMAELVLETVENEEPSFDDGGDCGVQVQQTMESMDLDGNWTQERVQSPPVGQIRNDFDVDEFEQEENEAAEDEMIGDDVCSDSEESENEEVGSPGMCAPVRGMPSGVPLEVLHATHTHGNLATGYPVDGEEYEGWGRVRVAEPYVAPPSYTSAELTQLREAGLPFTGVPNYMDVSMSHMAVCDTGLQICKESLYNHENLILRKGMLFNTMSEMKLFLQDYAVYHHRPYTVRHSDKEVKFQIVCKAGFPCTWKLNARKRSSDGKWKVTSVEQPHRCQTNKGKRYHPQLTARYLARRILGLVDADNDVSVSFLQETIATFVGYEVTYGKAWRAKQIALAIRWGSWEEAYNRVPRILCAMQHFNPGMRWFIYTGGFYLQNPLRHILYRVFWYFDQCKHAFQYCRPVVLVDGTFLTGKYRGTLMMAAAVDPENQIVPLAFALAEGENNDSWSWFMRLLRLHVLGPSRTICLISDRHIGILNAAGEHIDGHPPLVHRWCMRHFAANFWRRQRKKEVADKLKELCNKRTEHEFKETMAELQKMMNRAGKAWLDQQMENKAKWALAYDEGGFRYGIMTTNSSESFNRVFKGVRSLPVSGIVEFSFKKCNEYFVTRYGLALRNEEELGRWGKAAHEYLQEAEELSKQQVGEAYGRDRLVFSVRARGGTNLGGERFGGRTYRVDLEKVECSCNVPQIMHAPCSHMITSCRLRGFDHTVEPYMSPLYLRANTLNVWEKSFEPYLDES